MSTAFRSTVVVVTVVAIIAYTVPLLASAQAGHGRHAGARVARFLDLSEDQVARWQEVRDRHAQAAEPLREEQRQLRAELRTALQSGSPDPAEVGALVIRIHEARSQLKTLHASYVDEFTEMLSPSQQRMYEDVLRQRSRRGIDRAFGRARIVPPGDRLSGPRR
jgi:Spy/CpxP family protein refolding chaperone